MASILSIALMASILSMVWEMKLNSKGAFLFPALTSSRDHMGDWGPPGLPS